MILLRSLQLNNFLSHENTTISFNKTEKLLVDGKSGSGKSSITEAIIWCLYGRGRVENRFLIRRGSKTASAHLRLADGDFETIITRTISGAGKNTLTVTQKTGSKGQFLPIERVGIKDTQDWIENVFLKASYELFTNSIAYPQENENSFVKANASRRKDLLLEIVQAGNFDELYEKARKALSSTEMEIVEKSAVLSEIAKNIKSAEEIASGLEGFTKKRDELVIEIETFQRLEKETEEKVNNISNQFRQITDKKSVSDLLMTSLLKIDKQLADDQKSIASYKLIDIEKARKNVEEATKLNLEAIEIEKTINNNALAQQKINAHLADKPSVFDYSKDIELLNKRIIPLLKDTGKCPAGDKCPFVIPIRGQIDFLVEQIEEKARRSVSEQEALERWEKIYVSLVPTQDTTVLVSRLNEIKERIKVLSPSLNDITMYGLMEKMVADVNAREKKLKEERTTQEEKFISVCREIEELEKEFAKNDSNKLNIELSQIRIALQKIQKMKDEAAINVVMATNALQTIEIAVKELEKNKVGLSALSENKVNLEALKEALSPKGIKAVAVDYIIPQLEDRINAILGQLSEFRIRLDTQQSKMNEEDGVKEGLFIFIRNPEGEELSFQNLSGGESVKVTTAISEALTSLQNSVGFRIMDENVVSLDRESTESFVEILTKLQDKMPQLILISHIEEIKNLFSKKIEIRKINGISKIQ